MAEGKKTFDVVVVGAGIVGTACAWECVRARLKVAVIDRGPVGGGATGSGMGRIAASDGSDAQFALTNYSQKIWRELAADLPDDIEYEERGTLWIAADEEQMAAARRKKDSFAKRRIASQILDPAQLAVAEPNLRPGLGGALLVPIDGMIYPPCAALYFLERATGRGAKFLSGAEVTAVAPGEVTLRDGSKIAAGIVVVAAGKQSSHFCDGVPLQPCTGHLAITDRYPKFIRHQIIETGCPKNADEPAGASVQLNVQPRTTGQILIGSSRQPGIDGPDVDHEILGRMLARAREFLPALGSLSVVRVWTGRRAATPDNLPLIGPSLASDKIWLATGHDESGVTTSAGTARLLVDQLLKRKPAIPFEPYLPSRFAGGAKSHEAKSEASHG